MRDLIGFIAVASAVVLFLLVPAGLLLGGGFWLSYMSCQSQLKVSGVSGTWGPLIDCQVQLADGSYVPLSNWRGFEQVERRRSNAD